jgi:hypothetical protein
MDSAALDSLYLDALDAINAPVDSSCLDFLDTPADTLPPNASLDAQTNDVLEPSYDPLDAFLLESLNNGNTPLDASILDTLSAQNAPFDTSCLDFLDNIGGHVDEAGGKE